MTLAVLLKVLILQFLIQTNNRDDTQPIFACWTNWLRPDYMPEYVVNFKYQFSVCLLLWTINHIEGNVLTLEIIFVEQNSLDKVFK